jgi:hypothetical protein
MIGRSTTDLAVSEALKDFNFFQTLFWVIPGTFMVLFRSFALRGSFPPLKKDDLSTLVLGSVVYAFLLILFQLNLSDKNVWTKLHPVVWLLVLIVSPAVIGFLLGWLEGSDLVGRGLRYAGMAIPSPEPTAWENLFGDLRINAVLLVTLKDDVHVFGRWLGGRWGSAASNDTKVRDLYLAEIGTINKHGQYVAQEPRRGIYIAPEEIRWIEVIEPD